MAPVALTAIEPELLTLPSSWARTAPATRALVTRTPTVTAPTLMPLAVAIASLRSPAPCRSAVTATAPLLASVAPLPTPAWT